MIEDVARLLTTEALTRKLAGVATRPVKETMVTNPCCLTDAETGEFLLVLIFVASLRATANASWPRRYETLIERERLDESKDTGVIVALIEPESDFPLGLLSDIRISLAGGRRRVERNSGVCLKKGTSAISLR